MLAGRWAPTDRYFLDPAALMRDAAHPPDEWQDRLLASAARRILVLCSRQSGKSLTAAALALLTAILEAPALVLIVARAQRQAAELLRKVKLLYALLSRKVARPPPWAPRPVKELEAEERRVLGPAEALTQDSVLSMELANGSRIIALPGKPDTVVGYSAASLIIIDEAARTDDAMYYLLRPMLAVSRGRLVCLTTPFGKRGWFYEEWSKGGAVWERYRATAADCPRISPEFLAEERRALGAHWYGQEYMLEFRDAVDQVFRQDDIDAMFRDDVQPLFAE